jgi:hypothetical protein
MTARQGGAHLHPSQRSVEVGVREVPVQRVPLVFQPAEQAIELAVGGVVPCATHEREVLGVAFEIAYVCLDVRAVV